MSSIYKNIIISIGGIAISLIAALIFSLNLIYAYLIVLVILFLYNAYIVYNKKENDKLMKYRFKILIGVIYLVESAICILLYKTNIIEKTLSISYLYYIFGFSIVYIILNIALMLNKKSQ